MERLAAESSLPATTLALNRTTSGRIPPPDLYQFSLAPEDEAEEVARQALARGYSSALMIYPDSSWGLRVARAFREAWEGLGGVLEAGYPYGPGTYDLSEPLDKLFQMAEFGMDGQGLGTMADFVFLIGAAGQVREIWPQIRERVDGRLPVFCTSHVNDGRSSGIRVQELAGIYFVDIPWMIGPPRGEDSYLSRFRAGSHRFDHDYQRLFAMGVDGYRLLPLVGGAPASVSQLTVAERS